MTLKEIDEGTVQRVVDNVTGPILDAADGLLGRALISVRPKSGSPRIDQPVDEGTVSGPGSDGGSDYLIPTKASSPCWVARILSFELVAVQSRRSFQPCSRLGVVQVDPARVASNSR